MIETRPDWCISRQRTWGVPIPAVVCTPCLKDDPGAFLREPRFFEHVSRLVGDEGSDAWFGAPDGSGGHRPYRDAAERLDRLVPAGVVCPKCLGREHLAIHDHIVDVWFESGVSHGAVLGRSPALPWPADVYLEGHDQYRGWFHSSLLLAVHDRGRAPYKGVVTHGFTLDGEGRKMSKSLGNTISPLEVVDRRGAEILRLWVSMVDFLEDMRLSQEILDRNAEAYRKIRNTFRYLIGNLNDFDPSRDALAPSSLLEVDRFALARYARVAQQVLPAYEAYDFQAIFHGLNEFVTVDLSAFYLDVSKDRLYTFRRDSRERRSAQTAQYLIADGLTRLVAPILSVTAEEIWAHLPGSRETSVHLADFPTGFEIFRDPDLEARWSALLEVRSAVNAALEVARNDKVIGAPLTAHVALSAPPETHALLARDLADLPMLFIVSSVAVEPLAGAAVTPAVSHAAGEKCPRCWRFVTERVPDGDLAGLCLRCADAVGDTVGAAS